MMRQLAAVFTLIYTFRRTVFSEAQHSIANQPERFALSLHARLCALLMLSTPRLNLFLHETTHNNAAFDPNVCLSPIAVTALELQQPCTLHAAPIPIVTNVSCPMFYPQQALYPFDLDSRFVLTMLADAAACQSRRQDRF
jgi:hypothetical protein